MIEEGRVKVDGEVVKTMGYTLEPENSVSLDGNRVVPEKLFYVAMHKPRGVITTLDDPDNRPTVKALLPRLDVMLRPVGRLDMDSSGLLFFTNDGEFASKITHAKYGVHKSYEAIVSGIPNERAIIRLRRGITIDGYRTSPARVEVISRRRSGDTKVFIELREGRNRQIRKMFEIVGTRVLDLKRVGIGPIRIGKLAPGQCRTLSRKEVQILTEMADKNLARSKEEAKETSRDSSREAGDRGDTRGRRSPGPSTSRPKKPNRSSRRD